MKNDGVGAEAYGGCFLFNLYLPLLLMLRPFAHYVEHIVD